MNDLIQVIDGTPKVTTKDIADRFGKTHRDVMRAVGLMECSDDFRERNFARSSYKSNQNKQFSCLEMTRDGFSFLCMGFTGKRAGQWKESYIEAFNKMESFIKNESSDLSLIGSINILSKRLDDLAAAGSVWGKTGTEIRRRKLQATTELTILIDKAQMQLSF